MKKRHQPSTLKVYSQRNTIYIDLKELHKEKYSEPQFRLWARMISNGLHSSKSDPPQVPMIVGHSGTRSSKKSFKDTIVNAVAVVTIWKQQPLHVQF